MLGYIDPYSAIFIGFGGCKYSNVLAGIVCRLDIQLRFIVMAIFLVVLKRI